jgi:hypothetical protein
MTMPNTTDSTPDPHMAATSNARPSRRWDRAPESAVERRFFDLRESGYTGPFDWDTGQPCTDPAVLDTFTALDRATDRAPRADADADEC